MKSKSSQNKEKQIAAQKQAEKKKAVMAGGLVLVMVFMWAKVVLNKKTVEPAAADTVSVPQQSQSENKMKITYIELPLVEGRNDCLNRDIFDRKLWLSNLKNGHLQTQYGSAQLNGQSDYSDNADAETIQKAADELRLDAILTGSNPQAFINDKLLSQGQKIATQYEGAEYIFTVETISKNKVELDCKGVAITKKILPVE